MYRFAIAIILTRQKIVPAQMRHCFAGPTSSGTRLIDYWMSLTVIAALREIAAAAAAVLGGCQQLVNRATNECWCMRTDIAADADVAVGDDGVVLQPKHSLETNQIAVFQKCRTDFCNASPYRVSMNCRKQSSIHRADTMYQNTISRKWAYEVWNMFVDCFNVILMPIASDLK